MSDASLSADRPAATLSTGSCGMRALAVLGGWLLFRSGFRRGGLVGILGIMTGAALVTRGLTGSTAGTMMHVDESSRAPAPAEGLESKAL
jgi:uncharacterized membrane protein